MFGQHWVQMSNPAAELKTSMPTPASIAQAAPNDQPGIYCNMLAEKTGITKVEIINNEVIAAGQNKQS